MGLAAFVPQSGLLYQKCGTPGYVAPELFSKNGYDFKADIFSLGSCFYNLLTGWYLFSGKNSDDLLQKNMACKTEHVASFLQNVSPLCRDLLQLMIRKDPAERPFAHEALKHPWFKGDSVVLS